MHHIALRTCLAILVFSAMVKWGSSAEIAVEPLLKRINSIGSRGQAHQPAIAAWQQLVAAEVGSLTD